MTVWANIGDGVVFMAQLDDPTDGILHNVIILFPLVLQSQQWDPPPPPPEICLGGVILKVTLNQGANYMSVHYSWFSIFLDILKLFIFQAHSEPQFFIT